MMGVRRTPWSGEDIEMLRNNIHLPTPEIAKLLGRSTHAITVKIRESGLKGEKTYWEREWLKKNHEKPIYQLEKEMGRGRLSINSMLKDMGIEKRFKGPGPGEIKDTCEVDVEGIAERDRKEFEYRLTRQQEEKLKGLEVGKWVKLTETYQDAKQTYDGGTKREMKGKIISDCGKFFLFQHEKSGRKESFLKTDFITGYLRAETI